MATDSTVVYTPENNGGSVPAWLAYNNGGFGNGLGGWGGGILGFLLGLFFGNGGWGNGFGGFGGGWGGNSGAGFLSNQINNDSGRELLMNAITSQGEAGRTATQSLATALGQDFNLVNAGIQTIQGALSSLALQQAVSVPQIINSIQSGNASLASDLCRCCCEQRQLTVEQGYQAQLRTLEQTTALAGQADRNTAAITAAIAGQTTMINDKFCDLEKREMQAKIAGQAETISQLRGQIDNANQTAAITGYVNSLVAPLSAKVDQIAAKQLPTVNVQWPQLQAVNTTPYVSGGYYGPYGYGYGNNGLVF